MLGLNIEWVLSAPSQHPVWLQVQPAVEWMASQVQSQMMRRDFWLQPACVALFFPTESH